MCHSACLVQLEPILLYWEETAFVISVQGGPTMALLVPRCCQLALDAVLDPSQGWSAPQCLQRVRLVLLGPTPVLLDFRHIHPCGS